MWISAAEATEALRAQIGAVITSSGDGRGLVGGGCGRRGTCCALLEHPFVAARQHYHRPVSTTAAADVAAISQ